VRTRVGHSFIKQTMADTDAVFGGEHAGVGAPEVAEVVVRGVLAALHLLAALGTQEAPLSALMADYDRYAASGEINSTVADQAAATAQVRSAFADRADFDELDGLTAALQDGSWFNLRASNTEPLLRLNVEAADEQAMSALRDEVLAIIRT